MHNYLQAANADNGVQPVRLPATNHNASIRKWWGGAGLLILCALDPQLDERAPTNATTSSSFERLISGMASDCTQASRSNAMDMHQAWKRRIMNERSRIVYRKNGPGDYGVLVDGILIGWVWRNPVYRSRWLNNAGCCAFPVGTRREATELLIAFRRDEMRFWPDWSRLFARLLLRPVP